MGNGVYTKWRTMVDKQTILIDMQSEDPQIRYQACKQLANEPVLSEEVYDGLQDLSEDKDPHVRGAARHVLFKRFGVSLIKQEPQQLRPFHHPITTHNEPSNHSSLSENAQSRITIQRPKHPWFKIWIKPRETIREIINYNPDYLVIPLAIIAGLGRALDRTWMSMIDSYDLYFGVFLVLVGGPLAGVVSIYIGGELFSWIGKRLGGNGSAKEVRTALAWATIPWVLVLVIDIFQMVIIKIFYSSNPLRYRAVIESSPTGLLPTIYGAGLIVIGLATGVWLLVLLIKCVAEAHKFSSWRSLATLAIPFSIILGVGLICISTV